MPVGLTRLPHGLLWLREQRVMIDANLAELYGVPTKVLVQAVKRNSRAQFKQVFDALRQRTTPRDPPKDVTPEA